MNLVYNFNRERSKRTGEEMFIGCPECGSFDWGVVVQNLGVNVIPVSLVCASVECDGKTVATITNGIIDD